MEKSKDKEVKLEIETEDTEPSASVTEATFKGRLNIADYAFSPKLDIKSESASPSPSLDRATLQKASSSTLESSSYPLTRGKRKPSTLKSSSPIKRARSASGYAPPSAYAHLPELRDILVPSLICVFIGLNPGITTATSGHAYAHPSNLFWKLLHSSGCTTRRCRPQEDGDLPHLFALGNTNIVSRPTRNGSELSKGEMDASVQVLEEKIAKFKPEAVCIVGKSIWESVWRVRHGRGIKKDEFRYGWQDQSENMGVVVTAGEEWEGAKVFVATSTSGLAASLRPHEKEAIWRQLGSWIEDRRAERAGVKEEVIE